MKGIKEGDRVASLGFGAMAEYVCVEPNAIGIAPVIIPDNVSYDEAATNDPLVVAFAAVRHGNPQPDDKVLVLGAGAVGLSALQHFKADFPVQQVIAVDISEKRLEAALKMGADVVINARKENVEERIADLAGIEPTMFLPKNASEVSLVLECAGAKNTMQLGLEVMRPDGGRMVCVASYHDPIQIDPSYIVIKAMKVFGSMSYASDDWAHGIELMATGRVDRKPFISHRIPLERAKEAFELQCNVDESVKVLIIP